MHRRQLLMGCCLLALWCGATVLVRAQNGFAVQVAAVQSRAEAEALANGFRVRGLHAYWVKAEVPGKGTYYRVRVGGQFPNNQSAVNFGQKLKTAGLINTYAIFKYDLPTSALDEHIARANVNAPLARQADKPPASTPKLVNASAERPVVNAAPRTDYLISGQPLPASELERSASKPEKTPPDVTAAAANPTAPVAKAKTKHSDEIELDDFIEFTKILRGTIEPQADRLQVTLQNINKRHRFRGQVKLTFTENGRETKQAPIDIEIAPGQEHAFEVNPSVGRAGNYTLTVYDDQGALQLMQSGALNQQANRNQVAEHRQSKPQPPATAQPTGDVPPSLPPLEPTEDGTPPQAGGMKTANYPTGKVDDEEGTNKPEQPSEPSLPGDVKIIPRKVSETSENITLEFEILAQQPLGMITMALRTATVNEAKQAIMTTKQGRLPFLVPVGDTTSAFSYELKNEQGVLLAAGQMNFQQLKRD